MVTTGSLIVYPGIDDIQSEMDKIPDGATLTRYWIDDEVGAVHIDYAYHESPLDN